MSQVMQIDRERRQRLLIRQIRQVLKTMPGFEDDGPRLAGAMLQHFFGDDPALSLAEDHLARPDLYSPFSGEPEYEAYFLCRVELTPTELAEAERRLLERRPEFLGTVIHPARA